MSFRDVDGAAAATKRVQKTGSDVIWAESATVETKVVAEVPARLQFPPVMLAEGASAGAGQVCQVQAVAFHLRGALLSLTLSNTRSRAAPGVGGGRQEEVDKDREAEPELV